MPKTHRIQIDSRKVRKLRQDLSSKVGHDLSQEEVARQFGVSRIILHYMESTEETKTRRFNFENVFLVARGYREGLGNPTITSDYLVMQLDRLNPPPRMAEPPADYEVRSATEMRLREKLGDLDVDQLKQLTEFLEFLVVRAFQEPDK